MRGECKGEDGLRTHLAFFNYGNFDGKRGKWRVERTGGRKRQQRLEIATCLGARLPLRPLGGELARAANAFLGFQLPSAAADTNLEIIISVGGGANERTAEGTESDTDRQAVSTTNANGRATGTSFSHLN